MSRANRTFIQADAQLKGTRKIQSDFIQVLKLYINKEGRPIYNLNKQKEKERKELMNSIESGMQEQDLESVNESLFLATRQIQLVQFSEFERTRSDGYSGVKQIKSNGGEFTNLLNVM